MASTNIIPNDRPTCGQDISNMREYFNVPVNTWASSVYSLSMNRFSEIVNGVRDKETGALITHKDGVALQVPYQPLSDIPQAILTRALDHYKPLTEEDFLNPDKNPLSQVNLMNSPEFLTITNIYQRLSKYDLGKHQYDSVVFNSPENRQIPVRIFSLILGCEATAASRWLPSSVLKGDQDTDSELPVYMRDPGTSGQNPSRVVILLGALLLWKLDQAKASGRSPKTVFDDWIKNVIDVEAKTRMISEESETRIENAGWDFSLASQTELALMKNPQAAAKVWSTGRWNERKRRPVKTSQTVTEVKQ